MRRREGTTRRKIKRPHTRSHRQIHIVRVWGIEVGQFYTFDAAELVSFPQLRVQRHCVVGQHRIELWCQERSRMGMGG